MPWEWKSVPDWWIERLSIWLNAKEHAKDLGKPMSQEQVAPFVPSRAESEAYLREQGMLP
jgi:hypothetical protein